MINLLAELDGPVKSLGPWASGLRAGFTDAPSLCWQVYYTRSVFKPLALFSIKKQDSSSKQNGLAPSLEEIRTSPFTCPVMTDCPIRPLNPSLLDLG